MVKIKDILQIKKVATLQSQQLQKLQEPYGKIRLLTAGNFEGYTNHKMEGLEKEIDLRTKQYEYYRNQLFNIV